MKVTNIFGVHRVWEDALLGDDYDGPAIDTVNRTISVTTLIAPVQITILQRRFASELTEDVSDAAFKIIGTAVHSLNDLARRRNPGNFLVEERFFSSYMVAGLKWDVTGKVDEYAKEERTITDFKVTGTYSVMGEPKPEWEAQLNVLADIMEKAGHPVRKVQIAAFLRDWMVSKASTPRYPRHPLPTLSYPLWTSGRRQEYIIERLSAIAPHWLPAIEPPPLPECTEEEMWSGRRCAGYCPVVNFCEQGQAAKKRLQKNGKQLLA